MQVPLPADVTPKASLEWVVSWPWAEGAMVLFGFVWGAMLGSFVNVVVHRLPLGQSVVARRSRCPHCGKPVRATDNVPVLGWLRLRGKCRDCGGRIAATYPLVEAGCGLVGAVFATTHLAAGGRWLPRMIDDFPHGIDRVLRGDWTLVVACGLHVAVVLTIVAWSLLDEQATPAAADSLWPPLAAVIAVQAAVPGIAPAGPLPGGVDWPSGPAWLAAAVATCAGAAAGWLVGRAGPSTGVGLGLPLLGSVLGWEGVTIVGVVAVGIDRLAKSKHRGGAGMVLAILATLALAFQGLLRGWTAAVLVPGREA